MKQSMPKTKSDAPKFNPVKGAVRSVAKLPGMGGKNPNLVTFK